MLQEAALDSFEAVQHLSGIYTNEGFCVLALVVLYCLAEYGAKEGAPITSHWPFGVFFPWASESPQARFVITW
jgi:hypothetical protein